MSVKLVLLGFLRRGPMHGYELKRLIEREMGDWTDIAFGSIYFALEKLSEEGFVLGSAEATGKRPSRIVYTITDAGRDEYVRLLREQWDTHERRANPVDIAVAFLDDLPLDEVEERLRARLRHCEHALDHVRRHEAEIAALPGIPRQARFIFRHATLQLEAEREWARSVLNDLAPE